MGYEYDRTTDPDRAAARYRAKRDLSPDEFQEWEGNVSRMNRGEAPVSRAKLKGVKPPESDLVRSSALELGLEKKRDTSVPLYTDDGSGKPVRQANRGPGIYVPEDGAFGGGDINSPKAYQVAKFKGIDDRLLDDTAELRKQYSPEQKREMVFKARGMPMPELSEEEQLQKKLEGFDKKMAVLERFGGGGGGAAPKGQGFTSNNGGRAQGDFITGVMRDLGGDAGPLERAAEKAPAVAFNGRGPLMGGGESQAAPTAARDPFRQAIMRGVMEKELGIKLPEEVDPRKRSLEDERINAERETRRMQSELLQAEIDTKKAALAQSRLDPITRAKQNAELKKLERQMLQEGESETDKLIREAQEIDARGKVESARLKAGGGYSQQEIRQANTRSLESFRTSVAQMMQAGSSNEEAMKFAVDNINAERRQAGLPEMKPEDFGVTPQAKGGRAALLRLKQRGLDPDKMAGDARKAAFESRGTLEKMGTKFFPAAGMAQKFLGVQDARTDQLLDSNKEEVLKRLQQQYPEVNPEDLYEVLEMAKAKGL